MKRTIANAWKTLPSAVRKIIVGVIGSTLIILGLLLVVLPGPFTLPLIILGLFVLGLEYAWARRNLERVKEQGAKFNPLKLFKKQ